MHKITPHLYIGTPVDAHSILYLDSSIIRAVLDITPDLATSKWHKNREATLKKVGISGELTKPQIKKINTFIAEQHKQARPVLICGKTEDKTVAVIMAFLVGHKEMSVADATAKLETAGIEPKFSEKTLETIKKLEVKEELAPIV
jgi:hypothetical protein